MRDVFFDLAEIVLLCPAQQCVARLPGQLYLVRPFGSKRGAAQNDQCVGVTGRALTDQSGVHMRIGTPLDLEMTTEVAGTGHRHDRALSGSGVGMALRR